MKSVGIHYQINVEKNTVRSRKDPNMYTKNALQTVHCHGKKETGETLMVKNS